MINVSMEFMMCGDNVVFIAKH